MNKIFVANIQCVVKKLQKKGSENMYIYPRLRDLREDKDLTQKEIADILHIHQTTYSDYELENLNNVIANPDVL